jgi:hypothetical protein
MICGELCNFVGQSCRLLPLVDVLTVLIAYAFTEAIVVVRSFLSAQSRVFAEDTLSDAHGCTLRRDLRHSILHFPQ